MTVALRTYPRLADRQLERFPVEARLLRTLLAGHVGCDPYLLSPAYLQMTGRRGAHILRSEDTFTVVCRHPNNPWEDLLFYPHGPDKARLVALYADDCLRHDRRIPRIARVPVEALDSFLSDLNSAAPDGKRFVAEEESVLDWRYPVHTLCTHTVAAAQGHALKDFRKNLSRASRLTLETRPVITDQDTATLVDLGKRWAQEHSSVYCMTTEHELAEPYFWIGDALRRGNIDAEGFVCLQDGTVVAFILWERPHPGQTLVSSLASLSITQDKGVSEYLFWGMCDALARQGVDHVCIGGSETAGLDAFKRKMVPAFSQDMRTVVALSA